EEQLREHKEKAESRIDALKSRANETWERVERAFDERLNATLNRLGISSKSDIDHLNEQVTRLTELIAALRELEDED
ncbi:MAG TPA: phasin family protein, partial [Pseudomonadales bacterium]|nr:phasin family protein [Pseudomonadales bacterium]